jgi:16S rRNA U1498 N3-methylase RsmE
MQLREETRKRYILFAGPEGDLLDAEKFLLQKVDFHFVRLTPTVLRAQQAITLGAGLVRSML